jgi:ribosomal protein S9
MKLSTRIRGDMIQVSIEGTRAQLTALGAAISRAVIDEKLGHEYRIAEFIEVKIQMDPDHAAQTRGKLISMDARRQSSVRVRPSAASDTTSSD